MNAAGRRLMGIGLIVEVLDFRPPEISADGDLTVLLLAIAEDARDETRVGMPGMERLMSRCRCSRRTLARRLVKLADAGVLEVVSRSAPGRRAEYRIPPLTWTDATLVAHVPGPVDNPDPETAQNGPTDATMLAHVNQSGRVPHPAERVPLLVAHPPSNSPQLIKGSAVNGAVEGARDAPSVDNPDLDVSATKPRASRADRRALALRQAAEARAARERSQP